MMWNQSLSVIGQGVDGDGDQGPFSGHEEIDTFKFGVDALVVGDRFGSTIEQHAVAQGN